MARLLCGAAAAVTLCAFALPSQQPAEPAFDVASVKPSEPGATARKRKGGPGPEDPSLFSTRARTMKSLILMAYGVEDYQVSGGPVWTDTDRFDISAKPAAPASREQMLLMLRTLLADRFALRLHRETKPMPAYALSVAKNGPKFGPQFHGADAAALAADLGSKDSSPGIPIGGTMKDFAFLLRANMRLMHSDDSPWGAEPPPIIDQTGLSGLYVIRLKTSGPKDDLPMEVESQFGLRLDLRKLPMEVIVIDSASKPSPN